jgi:hypothetical protein
MEASVKFTHLLPMVALAASLATPAAAQQRVVTVTPYVWLPDIGGTLRFDLPSGITPDVSIGPSDYLENLDFGFMFGTEFRQNRWNAFSDFILLKFSDGAANVRTLSGSGGSVQIPIDTGSKLKIEGGMWTLRGGYQVVAEDNFMLDLFGGVRYLGLESELNWSLLGPVGLFPQSGTVESEEDVWDGIVGVRGEGRAGKWIFPFYLDVGAGSSDLTLQGAGGIGYNLGRWDIRLLYRYLEYQQDEDKLLKDASFSGPSLGASIRF